MNLRIHIRGAATVTVFVAVSVVVQARAQQVATAVAPLAMPVGYQTAAPGASLRQVSPVIYFRGILGMTPAQRERALAGQPPQFRNAIMHKVQEYEALPPDVREERLHQTQLLADLLALMKAAPATRGPLLREVPAPDRALLEARLRQWDAVPKAAQSTFLTNTAFLNSYLHWLSAPAAEQQRIMALWPLARQRDWTNELGQWQSLPEARRAQLCDEFSKFFELAPAAQQTTLTALSEEERKQMQSTLDQFARLPAEERQTLVHSFEKFATMPVAERDQFLGNAARWEAMTPDERELWRILVQSLPMLPPVPTAAEDLMPPAFPPLPPVPANN